MSRGLAGEEVLLAACLLAFLVYLCSPGGVKKELGRSRNCLNGDARTCLELKNEELLRENEHLKKQLSTSRWANLELRAHILNTGILISGMIVWTAMLSWWSIQVYFDRRDLEERQKGLDWVRTLLDDDRAEIREERSSLEALKNSKPEPAHVKELRQLKEENTGLADRLRRAIDMMESYRLRWLQAEDRLEGDLEECESNWKKQLDEAFSRIRCLKEEVLEESMKLFEEEEEHKGLKKAYRKLETELGDVKDAWKKDSAELAKLKTAGEDKASGSKGQGLSNMAGTSSGSRKGKRALGDD